MANMCAVLGDPGTGKSTLLNEIVQSHRAPDRRIWICPPYEAITGTDVGTIDDFCALDKWPMIARIDDSTERIVDLALEVGNTTVVIDEAHLWASKRYKEEDSSTALARLARRGRHHRVFCIWATQRPYDVNNLLRGLTENWYLFRLSAPESRNWAVQQFDSRTAEAVKNHSGFQPLFFNPAQGLRLAS